MKCNKKNSFITFSYKNIASSGDDKETPIIMNGYDGGFGILMELYINVFTSYRL